ncbi:hypothetical protein AAG570_000905 [Ranatra chinensis]|uniref:Lipocalin/cytosolic fatty-acid binding domain-containing protein n=1 Tax=Ranatra chinensis TaxID=642074 RepID=A0ABD0YYG4_9HEMI
MEVERSFYLVESPITCTKVNFTGNGNETLNVDITYKTPWRRTISSASYDADMYYEPGTINMILKTNLPFFVARLTPGSGKYVVLDTDYEQSALIYSCINWRFVHADFVWVLGRKMEISPEMRVKMYSILDKYNINRDRLFISSRNNC